MELNGVDTILTFDSDFDAFPDYPLVITGNGSRRTPKAQSQKPKAQSLKPN